MSRYARRVDGNHRAILGGLQRCGFVVLDLSRCGFGVPDLLVLIAPGIGLFLEVKDGSLSPSAQKLTKAEEKWMEFNAERTRVVMSFDEALQAVQEFKRELHAQVHRGR